MPVPMEIDDLHQIAILWEKTGHNNRGQYVVGEPVEINVRWEWMHEEKPQSGGNVVSIDATVYTDQVLIVGSILWLGELTDWYGTGSAGDNSDVMQVIESQRIPDIKNRNTRYAHKLMFFGDMIPRA